MKWNLLSAVILLPLSQVLFGQQPAKSSEAAIVGLRGPVQSVLTKYVDYRDNPDGKPTSSSLTIYDPRGYLAEEYRYDADGVLHSHTKYMRDEWRVFKTETTSTVPNESRTFVQSFNADGLVTGTETYDGTGLLIDRTTTAFQPTTGDPAISRSKTTLPDGTVSTTTTAETTDAATGITRQSVAKDGEQHSDWLIQRDTKGNPVTDALRFADGSFNLREVKPDGTTVEHKYWAPTKTHTYQTADAHNHTLEVINESPHDYTKTTFRYDGAGRQTEIANYDKSGKLLRRVTTRYEVDGNGNWIEQKDFLWEAATGKSKLSSVSRRIITYY